MNSAELLCIAKLLQSQGLKNVRINLSHTGHWSYYVGRSGELAAWQDSSIVQRCEGLESNYERQVGRKWPVFTVGAP